MQQLDILPHLFRSEYSKIVAVLVRRFGFTHLETAEDIASETFMIAAQSWGLQGLPVNPTAWLYSTAKNKAKNYLQRQSTFDQKIIPALIDRPTVEPEFTIDLSDKNITDSQLQMMFAVCHPTIPPESQIALALRVLCSFGIDEIADAFLVSKDTINKRLFRAKEKLRQENAEIVFPSEKEITTRLETVLTTLYLLFNEGYYSESIDSILREDLCLEAIRLTQMLIENPVTNQPDVNALIALMCFHASRFAARKNQKGEIVLYDDQDENLWDTALIARGAYHLHIASQGNAFSKYHLEAGIAYWHTQKADIPEKWENILQLYNRLLQIAYSPVAALNRTYALAKVKGKEVAIIEGEKLKLTGNHYYFLLLGELYQGLDNSIANSHLQTALQLAKTRTDKLSIQKKIDSILT